MFLVNNGVLLYNYYLSYARFLLNLAHENSLIPIKKNAVKTIMKKLSKMILQA